MKKEMVAMVLAGGQGSRLNCLLKIMQNLLFLLVESTELLTSL